MENKVMQKEMDTPQLRQMVLENIERINRNELTINKMRMEAAEQARKISEHDDRWENSRREQEHYMRISRERMDRLEKFAETSRLEHEKRNQELNELKEETWKQIKENSEQLKQVKEMITETNNQTNEKFAETRGLIAETNRDVKKIFEETNESIRRVSVEFLGVTGRIVEGLVSSSTEKIFREVGLDLHDSGKNLKRELVSENKQMEVDAMLGNENLVVPVEVKANFTKKKVKRFLHKMGMFRRFFPEYADKDVFAAVAAINYEAGADAVARENGSLVIRVNSKDIFSLDPVDMNYLRKF